MSGRTSALCVALALALCCDVTARGGAARDEPVSSEPGALRGTVRFQAGVEIPPPTLVENSTDPQACGQLQDREDLAVSPDHRGVRYVIVALTDVPAEMVPPFSPSRLVLDNRDCRFVPHAAVLTVGSTLEAVSHDPILHTVHLYGPVTRNIALPSPGVSATVELDAPGLVTILCDVHGWMQAYVRVDAHPYHAVSNADGEFRIDGIPPGTYTLEAWHERLGTRTLELRIEPGATTDVDLSYTLEHR